MQLTIRRIQINAILLVVGLKFLCRLEISFVSLGVTSFKVRYLIGKICG